VASLSPKTKQPVAAYPTENEDKVLEARIQNAVRHALAALSSSTTRSPLPRAPLPVAPTHNDLTNWTSKAIANAKAAHRIEVRHIMQAKQAQEAAAQEESRKAEEKSRML
jgi:hypothetical protein